MTMSDGALDLSISSYSLTSKHATRPLETVSSDSGRASSDSTSSEHHEDIKPDIKPSLHGYNISSPLSHSIRASHLSPGPVAFPGPHFRDMPHLSHMLLSNSSSSPPLTIHPGNVDNFSEQASPANLSSVSGDDLTKPALPTERALDPKLAVKPYKMFPVDPFSMYSNSMMPGAGGAISPAPVSMTSLYDSMSPSGFPSFPLMPLTSHLLQRKRRIDNKDHTSSTYTSSTPSSTANTVTSNSTSAHDSSSRVSTTSPVSHMDEGDSSNGSDGEKRKRNSSSADVKKDEAYWDRRRKNNEAAKRSRDARRQKEEEIAMRAAFLEQENLKLRAQVAILKNETAKLHYMLYNRM